MADKKDELTIVRPINSTTSDSDEAPVYVFNFGYMMPKCKVCCNA